MSQHVGVLSGVIVGAADVVVLDRSGGFDRLGWVLVEAVVEDRLDGAVAVGADGQRAARGGLHRRASP